MTNTIPNVPRELLERIASTCMNTMPLGDREAFKALLAAPSPAGVDGLHSLTGEYHADCSALMAIIDGLLGELQQSYQQVNSECMDWAKEYERRKAVQAERDTLKSMLREFAVGISKREMPTEQELNSWFDRIDAALSAGKEG